jgi:hypothetical protein
MKYLGILWIIAAAIAAYALIIADSAGLAIFDAILLAFDLFMAWLNLRRPRRTTRP